jgi:hypothetical protein
MLRATPLHFSPSEKDSEKELSRLITSDSRILLSIATIAISSDSKILQARPLLPGIIFVYNFAVIARAWCG